MSRKVLSCTEPAGQANDFELIPMVRMESQHSIGAPTCHHFPRFVIISAKSRPELANRWRWSTFLEKRPLKGKFSKKNSKKIHHVTEPRLVCKFREIWLTGNRQSCALFTWQALPLSLLRGSRPKSVRASCKQYTRSSPNFIQICSLPAELYPNAWTSLKRATKYFQYSAKLLRRVFILV